MLPPDPIIPREVVWADPTKFLVKVSSQGNFISYLAPFQDTLNLWVAPIDDISTPKLISSSQHRLRDYWWAKNDDFILYTHDENGNENWQLFSYEFSTGKTQTLTPHGMQTKIIHISAKHPDKILIGLNKHSKYYTDVYLIDLQSGQMECIYENNEYWTFIADDDLNIRFGIKVDSKGGKYIDLSEKGYSKELTHIDLHDVSGLFYFQRLRLPIAANNKKLYLTQSLDSNTSNLVSVALEDGQIEKIGHNAQADICDVLISPSSYEPIAFAINYHRKEWYGLEERIEQDFAYLKSIDDGDFDILSQTENNEIWLVNFVHDNGPITYYLYNRKSQQAQFLFNSYDKLEKYPFTKMHSRTIIVRDGTKCVSYLSLPRQSDINETGVPCKPVPLVLLVHGGPNYRDFWGFNPTHQWLANRGYAVLSVNYRASAGFGKLLLNAGQGEWGGKIQTDLLDAVEWAIAEGITTKDKVAIMGRSFGGYCTLVGLTRTPDTFCCGVDIVGFSNLETMAKHLPPYWKSMREAIHKTIGFNPESPEGKKYYKDRSPLYKADKIKKPLLIAHGANDVRVKQDESDSMVKAMQANNIPVTYAVFPDEGHQFRHAGNRRAFYALVESFLARVLGGACEPYDQSVQTSMQVKVDDFGLYSPP